MNYIAELERGKAFADGQAAAAQYWMERAERAERDLLLRTIALVAAAGGHIKVAKEDLHELQRLELLIEEDVQRREVLFRTRVQSKSRG